MADFDPRRKGPPDDDDWPSIWDAMDKARKSWIVVGPLHAVITNWKAIIAVGAFVVWFNRPEIAAAFRTIFGGGL